MLSRFVLFWFLATPAIDVQVDISKAPDAGNFATRANTLFREWYPRINELLYGAGHPLPYTTLKIVFKPKLDAPAYANGNTVFVDASYIRNMPDDFGAMMIHELTHINQHYPDTSEDAGWLVEGIADYIRHKEYEKDIRPRLLVGSDFRLYGYSEKEPYFYSLETQQTDLRDRGYRASYTVASTFLYWLETTKDAGIVRRLNLALAQKRYTARLFSDYCKAPLDALWTEFISRGP